MPNRRMGNGEMTKEPTLTALEPVEVLRQVIEIVDMFEDENMRMASDTIFLNTALKLRRITEADDLTELTTADGHQHVVINMTARMIGDAIRERFGLPPKED